MIHCPKCHERLPDEASFCTYCGTRILPAEEREAERPRRCPACGSEAHGAFCPTCGRHIEEGDEPRSPTAAWQAGSTVLLGKYGGEPIAWRVLKREGERALLLSRDAIDCRPFHGASEEVRWDGCELRAWLNGEFLSAAFTVAEREGILTRGTVTWQSVPTFFTDAFRFPVRTRDAVFLLDDRSLLSLLDGEDARVCYPTVYARERGLSGDDFGAVPWLLRTTGQDPSLVARVDGDGDLDRFGIPTGEACGVRPALYVRVHGR